MRKLVPRERCMSQGARESRRSGEHRTLSRASRANFSAASLWPGVMSAKPCQCDAYTPEVRTDVRTPSMMRKFSTSRFRSSFDTEVAASRRSLCVTAQA